VQEGGRRRRRAVFTWQGQPVTREFGKIGKSLKNMVSPDDMYDAFGADTLRVYEMSMGPLEQSKPWETRAVVGSVRFLQRLWRNVVDEETGAAAGRRHRARSGADHGAAQDDRRGA
jgi:leucyl-tRNA synthetase